MRSHFVEAILSHASSSRGIVLSSRYPAVLGEPTHKATVNLSLASI